MPSCFLVSLFPVHAFLRNLVLCLKKQSCIECQDPAIKALGLQSLAHLCEADVIGNSCYLLSHSSFLTKNSLILDCLTFIIF